MLDANGNTMQAGMIAARNNVDIGANTIVNREHAVIQSLGNMSIGGALDANHRATGTAAYLQNASATIDAGRNLNLQVAQLDNLNNHFVTEQQRDDSLTKRVKYYVLNNSPVRYYEGIDAEIRNQDDIDKLIYIARNAICSLHQNATVIFKDSLTGEEPKSESPYQCPNTTSKNTADISSGGTDISSKKSMQFESNGNILFATPDSLHATQLIAAAKEGKAILVEKPVCLSLESGQAISKAIDQHPVLLAIAYHLRWHLMFRLIAQKAQRGELGMIHHMELRWGVNFIDHAKWRLDPANGGWCCLSVLGTHLIDLARWINVSTCGEVVKQTSKVTYLENTTIDITVSISLQFESGATADLFCSLVTEEPLSIKIHAEKAIVLGNHLAESNEKRSLTINDEPFAFKAINLYEHQLNAFIRCMSEKIPPEVPLSEGLINVVQLNMIKKNQIGRF